MIDRGFEVSTHNKAIVFFLMGAAVLLGWRIAAPMIGGIFTSPSWNWWSTSPAYQLWRWHGEVKHGPRLETSEGT
jgi:hypothetical protein